MANMTEEEKAQFLKDNPNMAGRMGNGQQRGTTSSAGNLVKVETGLENEKYIEIVSGLTEGQTVLITLPNISTSSSTNKKSGFSGMGGGYGSGMTGGRGGTSKK